MKKRRLRTELVVIAVSCSVISAGICIPVRATEQENAKTASTAAYAIEDYATSWRCIAEVLNNAGEAAVGTATATEKSESADLSAWADEHITQIYYDSFVHGDKGPEYQRYIVLHDTEGSGTGADVAHMWGNGGRSANNGIAAHFVIDKDGTITQCVPLDKIAHHAGYGDNGNNERFGITEDGRDSDIPEIYNDNITCYAMNSWSIGIEMVHKDNDPYPEAQLEALDELIAYIDGYYGFESTIIDHKMWRASNSDTSEAFAEYLANYQDHRTHE